MRKFLILLIALTVLLLSQPAAVLAEMGDPTGGCPDGFTLHHADHTHEGEHMHHHIGSDTDFNGDGWICAKHVGSSGNNHVHIDNFVPLP